MIISNKSSIYSWYVVFMNALIGISATAYFSQFSMIVEPLAISMDTSESFLLFSDTIKSLVIMIGMIISGPLYKIYGMRKLFIFTTLCLAIPQFIIPYNNSELVLILLKIIQGLSGIMFPVFIIIIVGWIKKVQSGLATALFNGLFYGGAGIGAAISGIVISKLSWEASFVILGIFTVLPAILWVFTIKENKLYIEESILEAKTSSSKNTQKKDSFLKMPITWLLICLFLSSTWIVQALSLDIPIWAKDIGYDSKSIGTIMSSLTFGFLFATLFSGKLSDFIATKKENKSFSRILVMGIGPLLSIISIVLLLLIDQTNFTLFYFCVLLTSFGGAWGLGSFYCILPELYSKETLPLSTGFIGGIGDITLPLAPLVVGVIFGSRGMWTLGWGCCIILSLISLLSCLFLLKISKKQI